jgi:DNA-binding CsgD family transcriptional regulator
MDYHKLIILIAHDYDDYELSDKMGYSIYTIRESISRLIKKYGCRSRSGIMLKALKNKDIQFDSHSTIVENQNSIITFKKKGQALTKNS